MKYLIIIPARGGSKGIKDKNIADVGGSPLIKYSIDVANQLVADHVVCEAVVSTDSLKIKEISEKHGANVPFLRPDSLASDTAKSIGFILHAIEFYEERNQTFDAVILFQPTSPLRKYEDVVEAIKIFEKSDSKSLISVYREDYICDLVTYHKNDNLAMPVNRLHNQGVRRQEHEKLYVRNGAIYITKVDYLKNEEKIISDIPAMYEMSKNASINIDTHEDLELIRWILKK